MRQSRRAATPGARCVMDGATRCVPIAAVHIVPCRAPGVMNGAPTVHRAARFRRAARSLRRGTARCVSFAPVRTKRRGATCDARNTAAPAPSWTVHCRAFPSCRGATRCVPVAPVHVVPCRAPGVINGAPTVTSPHVSVVPRVRYAAGRRDAYPLRRFTLCPAGHRAS